MASNQQYFLLSEVAARILPALCQLTTDPEKNVRDSVFRTIKGFLGKLEKVSEDPSLRESIGLCVILFFFRNRHSLYPNRFFIRIFNFCRGRRTRIHS